MSASDFASVVTYRPVPDNDDYRVGDDGSVWTKRHRRNWYRLKGYRDKDGYLSVGLWNHGVSVTRRVHRLVLVAFRGPCPNGFTAAHNNGVRDDNRLDNLRWDNHAGNIADKKIHGTHQCGEKQGGHKLTEEQVREIDALLLSGISQKVLAERFGVCIQEIEALASGRSWTHVTRLYNGSDVVSLTCQICGVHFEARRKVATRRKYCSSKCRVAARPSVPGRTRTCDFSV